MDQVWSKGSIPIGQQWFFASNNDADALLFRARAMAHGRLCRWPGHLRLVARCLFGSSGGLISLTLYVVCPSALANGPLVTADMPVSVFFTAAR